MRCFKIRICQQLPHKRILLALLADFSPPYHSAGRTFSHQRWMEPAKSTTTHLEDYLFSLLDHAPIALSHAIYCFFDSSNTSCLTYQTTPFLLSPLSGVAD